MVKYDLSLIFPARNEMFLSGTVERALKSTSEKTEIIAVLDGEWAEPPVVQNDRVSIIYAPESIGQRGATKLGIKLSRAKYVCKLDAHVVLEEGWDTKMLEAFKVSGDNVTMISTMRNLWMFDWKCGHCGWKKYQGPTPPKCGNEKCGKTDNLYRKMRWIGKERPQSNSFCFDAGVSNPDPKKCQPPHFQYFNDYTKRPEYKEALEKTGLTETMSLQGSCWMCTREKYWELKLSDENFGSWGNEGLENACKTWLSGGRVLANHKTWYAHMFRTQGGDFGFPYENRGRAIDKTKKEAWGFFLNKKWDKQVHPVSWLVEKFWPVKGWTQEQLDKLKEDEKLVKEPS